MTDQRSPDESDAFDRLFSPDDDGRAPHVHGRQLTDADYSSPRRAARERAAQEREIPEDPRLQSEHVDPQPPHTSRSARRRAEEPRIVAPKKRSKRGLVASIVVLVTLMAIAGGGLFVWTTFEPQIRELIGAQEPIDFEGTGTGQVLITIQTGDTGSDIGDTLAAAGVTKTSEAFYKVVLAQAVDPVFQPGVYQLAEEMSAQSALDAILDPANKIERTALIREGLSGAQIIDELSAATDIPVAEFASAIEDPSQYGIPAGVPSLEGWLFPAQYTFDPGLTATDVIRILVNRTIQSLDAAGVRPDDRERILTLASVIQREARVTEDFFKVSRVIQNRIDRGMSLQMDSTAQYGIQAKNGWLTVGVGDTVWSSAEALADDNGWNTYARAGLPVGPIASPGDLAIKAAMSPVDGAWIFFVTVNLQTGETVFSETIEQHDAAIEQLRTWCRANPDQGC